MGCPSVAVQEVDLLLVKKAGNADDVCTCVELAAVCNDGWNSQPLTPATRVQLLWAPSTLAPA